MRVGVIKVLMGWMLLVASLSSCNEDSGRKYPAVRMDMVMADIGSEGYTNSILVDNGDDLFVVENKKGQFSSFENEKIRAIAYYEPIYAKMEAVIYDIAPVQVVYPVPSEDLNLSKRDPMSLIRMWSGGGYLNIELGIQALNLSKHKMVFVDSPVGLNAKEVLLKLYHSVEDDIISATKNLIVSIPLSIYENRFEGEEYEIVLELNTKLGIAHYRINIEK